MTQEKQIQNKKPAATNSMRVASDQPTDSDFDKLLAKEKSLELSSFDQEVYDQLFRLAEVMANTGVVPDSLRTEGTKNNKKELPRERVVANCFLVAEQAHRWECSPFKLLGEAAIVHGKLGWEGKTINALIQKFAGVYLKFEYNDKSGDDLGVTVSGTLPNESEPRTIPGTVKSWKTTGDGSPWKMYDDIALRRQLSYRGSREWMRVHLPSVMFGVLAIDEIQDFGKKEPSTPATVIREKPINPFATHKQLSEPKPEAKSSDKGSPVIEKIFSAWKALKKTNDDKLKALEFHGYPNAMEFEEMSDDAQQKLLKELQKQMNKQAGKTKGQIDEERAAKKAEREGDDQ